MKTVVANISSYAGISVNAEHVYCKYKVFDRIIDILHNTYDLDDFSASSTINGEELKWYPNEEQAKYLEDKDGASSYCDFEYYMTFGTIRFNSDHQITMELRKQFPDCNLIIMHNDSIKSYYRIMALEEYYEAYDGLSSEDKELVVQHFFEKKLDDYNDYAKKSELFKRIFQNNLEEEFSEFVYNLTKSK